MKNRFILSAVFFLITGMTAVDDGIAATYKYVDKDGQVGFADDLQIIPEPYRATAILISGEAKEGEETPRAGSSVKTTGAGGPEVSVSAAPDPNTAASQMLLTPAAAKGLPFSIRLAISIGVVIASILVSVFLGRVGGLHGDDRAIHILRVSLSWLVVVYLVVAHAKDVLTIFGMAGKHVQAVSEKSAKKGEKAAKAIKTLDAMFEQAAEQAQEHDSGMKEVERALDR